MADFDDLISFKDGNLPLIISVPHGGTLKVDSIPTRTVGVLGTDKNTIPLGWDLIKSIQASLPGRTPSYVIAKLHRSKIDFNREFHQAFIQSSKLAKKIYQLYHGKINNFINNNLKEFNKSLLIDIHGFEKHKRPEGYRDVEIVLGTNNLTSIISGKIPKKEMDKNVRGEIINKFLDNGIEIAPGHPRRKEYVLSGGFITQKYGASHISNSSAIQIEFSDEIRVHDKELRAKVIRVLVGVLINEMMSV